MVNLRSRSTRNVSGLIALLAKNECMVRIWPMPMKRAHCFDDAGDDGGWSACVTAMAFIAPLYCLCKQHERLRYCFADSRDMRKKGAAQLPRVQRRRGGGWTRGGDKGRGCAAPKPKLLFAV